MRIRPASRADNEAIRAIYNAEVVGATNTFDLVERTAADQEVWLSQHQGIHPVIVAVEEREGEEVVLGFGSLSPYRNRPAYSTTVEDSVYIDPAHQGKGIGKALLLELLTLAASHGFHSVIARVTGENAVSAHLHESCGFTLVGREREVGRKHGRWLDVVELQILL